MRPGIRRVASLIAIACASAAIGCSPDSALAPHNRFDAGGGGGAGGAPPTAAGSGGRGEGGGLFETGVGCDDPKDGDGDLVADTLELAPDHDTDGDGTPDAKDDDSDGDGVADADEAANPLLDPSQPGQMRDDPCDALADSDGDGAPDLRDPDSDNDGVTDAQESQFDPDGSKGCRVLVDCDGDGVIDVIEVAAKSDPTNPDSAPADAGLYFVLPYEGDEQTKDFTFSAGVAKADIYFLVDTTASMQPAIDALKSSLSSQIIPSILNGDPDADPPIPAISDAWIGVGEVRDVPWGIYGQPGDHLYRNRFVVDGQQVVGNVAPPAKANGKAVAPESITTILGALVAGGGGDGPEATTQALWIAATNQPYAATVGGLWNPATAWPPYPVTCPEPGMFGVPCFRQGALPVFVVVTDAAFHNGPVASNAYDPEVVGGVRSYAEVANALDAIDAKIVGVPVAGNNQGAARADLIDLAKKTGSLYHDPAFGGTDRPLVPEADVATGAISNEVVRLLGLLAGAGLHDVTTSRTSYDCAGGVDCTGDGEPDLEYHNPIVPPGEGPFDASKLITKVATVPSQANPPPYADRDESTFYAVRGDAEVTFRVHARNDSVKPPSLLVMRALIRVQTPSGQVLGGPKGMKLVYFVIPEHVTIAK